MAVDTKPLLALVFAVSLGAAVAGDASAQTSRFSYVSKPGDPVGQGTSRVIKNAADASRVELAGGEGVSVVAYSGDLDYTLWVRAREGRKLVPGMYTGAVGYWENPQKPGISFAMEGNECASSVGAFEVLEAKLGPINYVERLHLRFKHACKGAPAGSYGEVVIRNPPPPPPITSKVVWDKRALLSRGGWITVTGTYTCSKEGEIGIFTRAKQTTASGKKLVGEMEAREDYLLTCDGTPRRIERVIYPENCRSFVTGPARLIYRAYMVDFEFGGGYAQTKAVNVKVVRGY